MTARLIARPSSFRAYRDDRVRLESNPGNLGIPASRNRGLELARGDYIALLDSDDYSYPERLGVQVDYLDRHPELVQIRQRLQPDGCRR